MEGYKRNRQGGWTDNALVILEPMQPLSTRVGVSELKEDLRRATCAKHKHNMKKLTDYMGKKYKEILDRNHTHEDYLLDLFNALVTVPNESFKSFVRAERQQWELGGTKQRVR